MASALLLAGCQPGGQNYLTNGIGSNLSAPDIRNTEMLQSQYFSYLCRQASSTFIPPEKHCPVSDWGLIAYQGMNDIDRRCDAYLQWLDNRKRSQGPWISQIGDTSAATTAILTDTSVGTHAINIVTQAFQLLTKSVENYHSRLLLEVNSSTIHTVVLNSRKQFREHLASQKVAIASKPQTEHVLRSYLRLCLPFAIEAKINNFSTLGAGGQDLGDNGTLGDLPVVSAALGSGSSAGISGGSGKNEGRNKTDDTNPDVIKMYGEKSGQTLQDLHDDQKRLCIAEVGGFGPQTRTAIAIYRRANAFPPNPSITGDGPFFDLTDDEEKRKLNAFRANEFVGVKCDSKRFINFYEATILREKTPVDDFISRVNRLAISGVTLDVKKNADGNITFNDSSFRNTIGELRKTLSKCGLTEELYDGQQHITKNLDDAINTAIEGLTDDNLASCLD